jgi:endogenous inhibitor of DNA gyrase (YacG/DUF329 family)
VKTTVETVEVGCDGCGKVVTAAHPKGWIELGLAVTPLDGGDQRSKSVDLCPECQARVVVPGVPNEPQAWRRLS